MVVAMGVNEPKPGFQFDLCKRNAFLEERGVQAPRLTKTGTTIAGIVFKVRWSPVLPCSTDP